MPPVAKPPRSQPQSYVYVLPHLVGQRKIRSHGFNAALMLCRDYVGHIQNEPDMYLRYLNLEAEITATCARIQNWAPIYIRAYLRKDPLPTMRPNQPPISYGDIANMTGIQLALGGVIDTQVDGTTVWEIKRKTGRMTHSISGQMSKLHMAGVVACLTLKR